MRTARDSAIVSRDLSKPTRVIFLSDGYGSTAKEAPVSEAVSCGYALKDVLNPSFRHLTASPLLTCAR
jgi:hypothetical protein